MGRFLVYQHTNELVVHYSRDQLVQCNGTQFPHLATRDLGASISQ